MVGRVSALRVLPVDDVDAGLSADAAGLPPDISPSRESVPYDPRRYRALYADLWFRFIRGHFRDAVEVAFVFGVDAKTGRDWWEGHTRSQGWAVAWAIEHIPAARAYLRVVK